MIPKEKNFLQRMKVFQLFGSYADLYLNSIIFGLIWFGTLAKQAFQTKSNRTVAIYVTVYGISVMCVMAHRCAGRLKK